MAPQFVLGDLFSQLTDVLAVTTNSYIQTNRQLVMGRGAALALATDRPMLAQAAGNYIMNTCKHLGTYGFFVIHGQGMHGTGALRQTYGFFQVKRHFRENADLDLMRYSVQCLNAWIADNPNKRVSLNFPGIGCGRREIHEVYTVINELSPWVTIYYRQTEHRAILTSIINGEEPYL